MPEERPGNPAFRWTVRAATWTITLFCLIGYLLAIYVLTYGLR